MGSLIKLILCLYLLSLVFSLFVALLRFIIDVGKWHVQEKKVKISKSNERSEYNGRINNSDDRGTGDNNSGSDTGTGDTRDGESGVSESGVGDTATGRIAIRF